MVGHYLLDMHDHCFFRLYGIPFCVHFSLPSIRFSAAQPLPWNTFKFLGSGALLWNCKELLEGGFQTKSRSRFRLQL